ncbi:hypothetical protein [Streptomyces sp. NPDC055210]
MVCLGAVTLVACGSGIGGGGGDGDGYVAVQRPSSPAKAVAPTGDVELVPLESGSAAKGRAGQPGSTSDGDSSRSGADTGSGTDAGTGSGGSGTGSSSAGTSGSSGAHDSGRTGPASGGGDGSGDTGGTADAGGAGGTSNAGGGDGSSGAGATSGAGTPSGPAVLVVGEPEREPADKRWCEKVTVGFRNTGGTAVRSGTVTFGTHVIGALGIDWATVEAAERLPVPIAPGSRTEKTWTVCVDAWRVPLGMHVETRDVSVRWE